MVVTIGAKGSSSAWAPARYPKLSVDLVTDIRTVNLHRRDADPALRMVKPERGHVTLQRLGTLGYGLYASQAYMDRRACSSDGADHDADDFITWDETHAHLPAARWVESQMQGKSPALTTSSLATQVSACSAGLGLAVLPHLLARPHDLICLNAELGVDQAIWLVTQPDLLQSRRVQTVAEFCRKTVQRHREALARPYARVS